jgi:type IV pilus assembly protein PilN
MDVIRQLEANRYEPVRLMEILTQMIIEKRMWFTLMETKPEAVAINGIAMDDKTVADFMVRLEGCGLFSAVSLKTLKQVEVQKTALKSFEISCQKKPLKKAETQGPEQAGAKKK